MALFRLKLCLELASAPAHQRFEQQKYTHAEQISKEKKFLDFEELDELFSRAAPRTWRRSGSR